MSNLRLAELDGLLRRGGVTIAPVETQGTEEFSLPLQDSEGGGEEKFLVTTLNQRKINGEITIWNTRTGEARSVDVNAVQAEMKKVHRAPEFPEWIGKPMYTLDVKSVPKPIIGKLLCPLNPKHPDYPKYQELGAQPCVKHTLPHELAVENHIRIKHQATWANMQRKHQRELEEEERAYRRWQMGQAPPVPGQPAALRDNQVVPSHAAPVSYAVQTPGAPTRTDTNFTGTSDPTITVDEFVAGPTQKRVPAGTEQFKGKCKTCGVELVSSSATGLKAKRGYHNQRNHPTSG